MCTSEELLRGQEAELLILIRSILSKHRLITLGTVFFLLPVRKNCMGYYMEQEDLLCYDIYQ